MPKGVLYINGQDAFTTWGISLEQTGITALIAPPPMKSVVESKSRLEHGKRVVNKLPRYEARDITLPLHLVAKDTSEFMSKFSSFCQELKKPDLLKISTSYSGDVYKCIYLSCTQFGEFLKGYGSFSLKLNEPNPDDRT